jgi:RNA polymerase sigma-70 factor, ECF subfamily
MADTSTQRSEGANQLVGHAPSVASPLGTKTSGGGIVGDSIWPQGDEESLVRQTLAGKRWAQREVWYRYSPMVYRMLRRALGPQHDHEDLMQEIFLRVFRRLHSLEKFSALRSFVFSVAFRVVSKDIRHFRKLGRTKSDLLHISREIDDAAADFEMRDVLLRIQGILDRLKDKHRAVFVLRHVEGMDLFEIALGLGISLASVKRYLAKAVRYVELSVARDGDLAASLSWLTPNKSHRGNG